MKRNRVGVDSFLGVDITYAETSVNEFRKPFTNYVIAVSLISSLPWPMAGWMVHQGESMTLPEIMRRYSRFHELHSLLLKRFGALSLPSLPPKKITGTMDPVFIQLRKQELQDYLLELLRRPLEISLSDEVCAFLDIPASWRQQISSAVSRNNQELDIPFVPNDDYNKNGQEYEKNIKNKGNPNFLSNNPKTVNSSQLMNNLFTVHNDLGVMNSNIKSEENKNMNRAQSDGDLSLSTRSEIRNENQKRDGPNLTENPAAASQSAPPFQANPATDIHANANVNPMQQQHQQASRSSILYVNELLHILEGFESSPVNNDNKNYNNINNMNSNNDKNDLNDGVLFPAGKVQSSIGGGIEGKYLFKAAALRVFLSWLIKSRPILSDPDIELLLIGRTSAHITSHDFENNNNNINNNNNSGVGLPKNNNNSNINNKAPKGANKNATQTSTYNQQQQQSQIPSSSHQLHTPRSTLNPIHSSPPPPSISFIQMASSASLIGLAGSVSLSIPPSNASCLALSTIHALLSKEFSAVADRVGFILFSLNKNVLRSLHLEVHISFSPMKKLALSIVYELCRRGTSEQGLIELLNGHAGSVMAANAFLSLKKRVSMSRLLIRKQAKDGQHFENEPKMNENDNLNRHSDKSMTMTMHMLNNTINGASGNVSLNNNGLNNHMSLNSQQPNSVYPFSSVTSNNMNAATAPSPSKYLPSGNSNFNHPQHQLDRFGFRFTSSASARPRPTVFESSAAAAAAHHQAPAVIASLEIHKRLVLLADVSAEIASIITEETRRTMTGLLRLNHVDKIQPATINSPIKFITVRNIRGSAAVLTRICDCCRLSSLSLELDPILSILSSKHRSRSSHNNNNNCSNNQDSSSMSGIFSYDPQNHFYCNGASNINTVVVTGGINRKQIQQQKDNKASSTQQHMAVSTCPNATISQSAKQFKPVLPQNTTNATQMPTTASLNDSSLPMNASRTNNNAINNNLINTDDRAIIADEDFSLQSSRADSTPTDHQNLTTAATAAHANIAAQKHQSQKKQTPKHVAATTANYSGNQTVRSRNAQFATASQHQNLTSPTSPQQVPANSNAHLFLRLVHEFARYLLSTQSSAGSQHQTSVMPAILMAMARLLQPPSPTSSANLVPSHRWLHIPAPQSLTEYRASLAVSRVAGSHAYIMRLQLLVPYSSVLVSATLIDPVPGAAFVLSTKNLEMGAEHQNFLQNVSNGTELIFPRLLSSATIAQLGDSTSLHACLISALSRPHSSLSLRLLRKVSVDTKTGSTVISFMSPSGMRDADTTFNDGIAHLPDALRFKNAKLMELGPSCIRITPVRTGAMKEVVSSSSSKFAPENDVTDDDLNLSATSSYECDNSNNEFEDISADDDDDITFDLCSVGTDENNSSCRYYYNYPTGNKIDSINGNNALHKRLSKWKKNSNSSCDNCCCCCCSPTLTSSSNSHLSSLINKHHHRNNKKCSSSCHSNTNLNHATATQQERRQSKFFKENGDGAFATPLINEIHLVQHPRQNQKTTTENNNKSGSFQSRRLSFALSVSSPSASSPVTVAGGRQSIRNKQSSNSTRRKQRQNQCCCCCCCCSASCIEKKVNNKGASNSLLHGVKPPYSLSVKQENSSSANMNLNKNKNKKDFATPQSQNISTVHHSDAILRQCSSSVSSSISSENSNLPIEHENQLDETNSNRIEKKPVSAADEKENDNNNNNNNNDDDESFWTEEGERRGCMQSSTSFDSSNKLSQHGAMDSDAESSALDELLLADTAVGSGFRDKIVNSLPGLPLNIKQTTAIGIKHRKLNSSLSKHSILGSHSGVMQNSNNSSINFYLTSGKGGGGDLQPPAVSNHPNSTSVPSQSNERRHHKHCSHHHHHHHPDGFCHHKNKYCIHRHNNHSPVKSKGGSIWKPTHKLSNTSSLNNNNDNNNNNDLMAALQSSSSNINLPKKSASQGEKIFSNPSFSSSSGNKSFPRHCRSHFRNHANAHHMHQISHQSMSPPSSRSEEEDDEDDNDTSTTSSSFHHGDENFLSAVDVPRALIDATLVVPASSSELISMEILSDRPSIWISILKFITCTDYVMHATTLAGDVHSNYRSSASSPPLNFGVSPPNMPPVTSSWTTVAANNNFRPREGILDPSSIKTPTINITSAPANTPDAPPAATSNSPSMGQPSQAARPSQPPLGLLAESAASVASMNASLVGQAVRSFSSSTANASSQPANRLLMPHATVADTPAPASNLSPSNIPHRPPNSVASSAGANFAISPPVSTAVAGGGGVNQIRSSIGPGRRRRGFFDGLPALTASLPGLQQQQGLSSNILTSTPASKQQDASLATSASSVMNVNERAGRPSEVHKITDVRKGVLGDSMTSEALNSDAGTFQHQEMAPLQNQSLNYSSGDFAQNLPSISDLPHSQQQQQRANNRLALIQQQPGSTQGNTYTSMNELDGFHSLDSPEKPTGNIRQIKVVMPFNHPFLTWFEHECNENLRKASEENQNP